MKLEPCGREACAQIINGLKRKWQGLTDEEVNDLKNWLDHRAQWSYIEFASAIEAKLREKNGF